MRARTCGVWIVVVGPGDPCRGRHGFFSAPGVIGGWASVAAPSAFLPMLTLAPGGTLSQPALFQLTIPASGVAPGAYQLFGALARVGAFLDNRIDPGRPGPGAPVGDGRSVASTR